MLVYRICDETEIENILNSKDFSSVGNYFIGDESQNTFKYEPNVKYMHFFGNLMDILYLDTSTNRCICTYDIPENVLELYTGYGKYWDYISFKSLLTIKEFSIPSSVLQFEYLKNVETLTSLIDYEDFISDSLSSFTKTLYIKK